MIRVTNLESKIIIKFFILLVEQNLTEPARSEQIPTAVNVFASSLLRSTLLVESRPAIFVGDGLAAGIHRTVSTPPESVARSDQAKPCCCHQQSASEERWFKY
jgi:hypothetical protein